MQNFSLFDIIGPRMVGPSSSHTAGAAKLGRMAWKIACGDVKAAELTLYGSFATTGRGHGTDKALVAGILGLAPDDARLRYSLLLAQEAGVSVDIRYSAHPHNECRRQGNGDRGRVHRRREHPHHRDQRHGS